MNDPQAAELLDLSHKLLSAIAEGDWGTYADLCDPTLTAFEPEAVGHRVHGLPFHEFYFKLSGGPVKPRNTLCDPHVRLMGDVAVVTYCRVVQRLDPQGNPVSRCVEETRVWQRQDGRWRHVHFHRSPAPSA